MTSANAAEIRDQLVAAISEDSVADLTSRLVRTRSVTGEEAALSQLLADELRYASFEVIIREFAPGRTNVFGRRKANGVAKQLLLAGHTDTVNVHDWERVWPDDQRRNPFGAIVVGPDLWGRGTADQKGGIAVILSAIQALDRLGLNSAYDITVAFVGDEESGEPGTGLSLGIRQYADMVLASELPKPDIAIYTEPTSLSVYTCQPGFIIGRVEVKGRASYFAFPWLGRDAIRNGHRILAALYSYADRLADGPKHVGIGNALMVITGMQGGESVAVSEHCAIDFIRTVLPAESMDRVADEIRTLVGSVSLDSDVTVNVSYTAGRDHVNGGMPSESGIGSPESEQLAAAVALVGGTPSVGAAPYWSEMPIVDKLGARTLYFGPGDISNCHTALERVPLLELTRAARALAVFLALSEDCISFVARSSSMATNPNFDHQ